jgi:hypothetical protein
MDAFASNYIKPRTSGLTNMNASLITVKRQSQIIFTGYEKGIQAITQKTVNRPTIFNGSDGLTVNNLKNGDTWTDPTTLNAIQNS